MKRYFSLSILVRDTCLYNDEQRKVFSFRCMTTRREHPDGALWRLAVEGFNQILSDDVKNLTTNVLTETCTSKPARTRIWKEVADVYEFFLVGYCGRAISSSLPSGSMEANESLEMTLLNILGDKILKSPLDAPHDVIFSSWLGSSIVQSYQLTF